MTENIVIVPELENNQWPDEFSGAWANIITSPLNNIVFSLYFNEDYPEGFILQDDNYLEFPDAYISIKPNGYIFEIYVLPALRRNKIGAMMCAWTRTNFIERGIVVKPPSHMTYQADLLYKYLSLEYQEPYNNPGYSPIFDIYLDFGGKSLMVYDEKYN